MDQATASVAARIIEEVTSYRKSLTSPLGNRHDLRITSLADEIDDTGWNPINGKEFTQDHVVGYNNESSLGFFATLIRIQSGCGAFHQHLETRYLDAGTEFFCAVHGKGYAFFESPVPGVTRNGTRWKDEYVKPGTCGLYRGALGHCYVNTGTIPLVLFIVCVPFPPTLSNEDEPMNRGPEGCASGIEFRISSILRTKLATDLKQLIINTCSRGDPIAATRIPSQPTYAGSAD